MNWDLITNISLILSFISLAIFAVIGVTQWIKRGSLKKVDRQILWMPLPLILMVIVYFIFDKVIHVNYRPDGSGEVSFPSTHAMVVATIFFMITMILPKYVKNKKIRVVLEVIMVVLTSITCTGRIFANKHDLIDVLGALLFAFIFTAIYHYAYKKAGKK